MNGASSCVGLHCAEYLTVSVLIADMNTHVQCKMTKMYQSGRCVVLQNGEDWRNQVVKHQKLEGS